MESRRKDGVVRYRKYSRDIVELSSGEGIAIGDRLCEFHIEDAYVYEH